MEAKAWGIYNPETEVLSPLTYLSRYTAKAGILGAGEIVVPVSVRYYAGFKNGKFKP